jgi:hypothetical protein
MILATQDLYGPTEVATMTVALQAVEMNHVRVVPEPSTIALLAIAAISERGHLARPAVCNRSVRCKTPSPVAAPRRARRPRSRKRYARAPGRRATSIYSLAASFAIDG